MGFCGVTASISASDPYLLAIVMHSNARILHTRYAIVVLCKLSFDRSCDLMTRCYEPLWDLLYCTVAIGPQATWSAIVGPV